MNIIVYAVLKDFFEKEFTVAESFKTIEELRRYMLKLNPDAGKVLAISRFAVNNIFVNNGFELKENDSIHIIPPSSGG